MPQLSIDVVHDSAKFLRLEVGINLDRVSSDGASVTENVSAGTVYFLTAYAVSNAANTPFSVQLTPDAGHAVRFPDDPKNVTGIVPWKATDPNQGHFRWRRFYLQTTPPGKGGKPKGGNP